MVMTDFVAEQFTLVNTAHKSNVKTNIALLKQLPTFQLPYTLNFEFKRTILPKEKSDILALISRMLAPQSVVSMYDALLEREAVSSTAIGNQIALPHVVSSLVDTPSLAVIQLPSPLDWQSKLGEVTMVIALALPKPIERPMLQSFTCLTKSLLNPEQCQLLTSSREPEAIKALLIHRLAQPFFPTE